MALPETYIRVTAAKTAIGESLTGVGGNRDSSKNNPWGFSSMIRGWGNRDPNAPFRLGDYRSYDHYWRCYNVSGDDTNITGDLIYYESGNIVVKLFAFPVWSAATSGVNHYFDVWFNRSNDFTHGTETKLHTDLLVQDLGQFSITINPTNPPDGGTLTPDSIVYLKVKWKSSPDRRFDPSYFFPSGIMTADTNDSNSWIISVPIGHRVYTNEVTFARYQNSLAYKNNPNGFIEAYATIYNGSPTEGNASLIFEINNQSDFNGLKGLSATKYTTIPAATRSGGNLILGSVQIGLRQSDYLTQWANGETFYGRVRITSASGNYSTGWSSGWGGVVTTTPPM